MKWLLWFILCVSLSGCLGLESEDVYKEFHYQPKLAIAIGNFSFKYNDIDDFPIIPPDTLIPFSFVDEVDVELNLSNLAYSAKDIYHLMLRVDLENRFPAGADLELFYSNSYGRRFSLLDEPIVIEPAVVDDDGKLILTKDMKMDLTFNRSQIHGLFESDLLIFVISVSDLTLDSTIVSHLLDYSLQVEAGIQVEVKIL